MPEFNREDYTTIPRMDTATAIAVAHAILNAAPKRAPAAVDEACDHVRTSLTALEASMKARAAQEALSDIARPADRAVDNVWAALHGRLYGLARLEAVDSPRAEKAKHILERLFPDGDLTFLNAKYLVEWTAIKQRIERVEKEKLIDEINDLAGPEYWPAIQRTFQVYGDALGITKTSLPSTDENHRTLLRNLVEAFEDYNFQILAMFKRGNQEKLDVIRKAFAPWDKLREQQRSSQASNSDTEEPKPDPNPQPA